MKSLRDHRGLMLRVTFGAAALTAVLTVVYLFDPLPEGLNATFFADANWSAAIARTTVDARLNTEGLYAGWRGEVPRTFSVSWSGALFVARDGTYTFATDSDDGSWVYVDRKLVVDN